ncbi:MAG: hypothetical protein KDA59_15535 [Planctomycetales bacterium]|nr:hypothetical protein [Planctomycetales bacterium]MCA9225250.1 hypothetical protein [Planctomycetales bacterium]
MKPPSSVNPYAAPSDATQRKRPPVRARFDVGKDERHTVEICLSIWTCEEVYVVDDIEVMRITSVAFRANRRFEVGEDEKHEVEVRVDMFPSAQALISPMWIAEVYVDGKLQVEELFPTMRRRLKAVYRVVNWLLMGLLAVIAVMLQILILLCLLILLIWIFDLRAVGR